MKVQYYAKFTARKIYFFVDLLQQYVLAHKFILSLPQRSIQYFNV